LSNNNRKQGFAAAAKLLGPGVNLIDYGVGMSGPWPTGVALAMLAGWVLVTAAAYVVLHAFVIVGLIPLIVVRWALNRPLAVATAPQGVALLERSFWNGRPDAVVALLPAGALVPTEARGNWVHLQALPYSFWVTKRELLRLQSHVGPGGAYSGPGVPPHVAPPHPGPAVPPVHVQAPAPSASPEVGYF
jgi:hypothetical protein